MYSHVLLQSTRVGDSFSADLTLVHFLTRMAPYVILEVCHACKRLLTKRAFIGFHVPVALLVQPEAFSRRKDFCTGLALVQFLLRVNVYMSLKLLCRGKGFVTN